MNDRIKVKIRAIEMVLLLIISGSAGYIIIIRQGLSSGQYENNQNDNPVQDTIKITAETPQSLQAHIKAGPLEGYPPLAVHFYGNPENDKNIVSYRWEFGPTTMPIIPQSKYSRIHFSFVFFFLFPIVSLLIYIHQVRINSQYISTDPDPTMIFLTTGSYSATLTITDAQGNTSSDTIWITVLQYVYPNNFSHLNNKEKI